MDAVVGIIQKWLKQIERGNSLTSSKLQRKLITSGLDGKYE